MRIIVYYMLINCGELFEINIMLTAEKVANYILSLSEPEFGDNISNLKLQKLLYYAQGFHLAMNGEKLFEEDIVAWEHGPVVQEIYHKYKIHGANAIEIPKKINFNDFNDDQINLLNEIYQVYGQFSAWKLRNMTHSEKPWVVTGQNEVIQPRILKSFFKTLLK